jgi:hypothetical protein
MKLAPGEGEGASKGKGKGGQSGKEWYCGCWGILKEVLFALAALPGPLLQPPRVALAG